MHNARSWSAAGSLFQLPAKEAAAEVLATRSVKLFSSRRFAGSTRNTAKGEVELRVPLARAALQHTPCSAPDVLRGTGAVRAFNSISAGLCTVSIATIATYTYAQLRHPTRAVASQWSQLHGAREAAAQRGRTISSSASLNTAEECGVDAQGAQQRSQAAVRTSLSARPQMVVYQRRGRNSGKLSSQFFVFPELLRKAGAQQARKPPVPPVAQAPAPLAPNGCAGEGSRVATESAAVLGQAALPAAAVSELDNSVAAQHGAATSLSPSVTSINQGPIPSFAPEFHAPEGSTSGGPESRSPATAISGERAVAAVRLDVPQSEQHSWDSPHLLLQQLRALVASPDLPAPAQRSQGQADFIAALSQSTPAAAADLWQRHETRALLLRACNHPSLSHEKRQRLTEVAMQGLHSSKAFYRRGGAPFDVDSFLALLDAVKFNRMASEPAYVGSVLQLLEGGLPQLKHEIAAMSAAQIVGCTSTLAEVLVRQGAKTRIQCDAAMDFMRTLLACPTAQAAPYTAGQLDTLSQALKLLFGVHRTNEWCSAAAALKRDGQDPGLTTRNAVVWGRALQVPNLHAFCKQLAARSVALMQEAQKQGENGLYTGINMLSTLASLQVPYLQTVSFLRFVTDALHTRIGMEDGGALGHRTLAHIMSSLGHLGVPFEKVYPLSRRIMLQARETRADFDLTSTYMMIDGLAKMRTPAPECAFVIHALMRNLCTGLDPESRNSELHASILACPPSQLIKLLLALKVLLPKTNSWRNIETEAHPVFMRAAASHLVRERLHELGHSDIQALLDLMSVSHLGGALPRPWRLDLSMRLVDRVAYTLFGTPPKPLRPTQFWTGLVRYDKAYTGTAAAQDASNSDSSAPNTDVPSDQPRAGIASLADAAAGNDVSSSVGGENYVPRSAPGRAGILPRLRADARGAAGGGERLSVRDLSLSDSLPPESYQQPGDVAEHATTSGWKSRTRVDTGAWREEGRSARVRGSAQRGGGGIRRGTRPFQAHDVVGMGISMANLWEDCPRDARANIRATTTQLVGLFGAHEFPVSRVAQLFWVLPKCDIPWAEHGSFLSTALRRVHDALPQLRPRDVAQTMKGLRMMAANGATLESSDIGALVAGAPTPLASTVEEWGRTDSLSLGAHDSRRDAAHLQHALLDAAPETAFPGAALGAVQRFVADAALHLAGVVHNAGRAEPPRGALGRSVVPGVGEGDERIRLVGLGEACHAAACLCSDADIGAVGSITGATLDALRLHCAGGGRALARAVVQPRTLAGVLAGVWRVVASEAELDELQRVDEHDVWYVYGLVRERIALFDLPAMRALLRAVCVLAPHTADPDLLLQSMEWVLGRGVSAAMHAGPHGSEQLIEVLGRIIQASRAAGYSWQARGGVDGQHWSRHSRDVLWVDPGIMLQLHATVRRARLAFARDQGVAEDGTADDLHVRTWQPGSWTAERLARFEALVEELIGTVEAHDVQEHAPFWDEGDDSEI